MHDFKNVTLLHTSEIFFFYIFNHFRIRRTLYNLFSYFFKTISRASLRSTSSLLANAIIERSIHPNFNLFINLKRRSSIISHFKNFLDNSPNSTIISKVLCSIGELFDFSYKRHLLFLKVFHIKKSTRYKKCFILYT